MDNSLLKAIMLVNDDLKVTGKDKRNPLSPHAKFDFEVSQKVAKINMEELSIFFDHNVVWMAVTNAKNICGHTVASTWETECLSGLLQSALREGREGGRGG